MSELKPCPFCGGEAIVGVTGPVLNGKLMNYAYCEDCFCATPAKKTEAEAAAAWNTRTDYHGYEQAAIEAWKSVKKWNTRHVETCRAVSMRERDKSPYLNDEQVCSECGCQLAHEFGNVWQNYCPNCGRKVEG